MTEPSPVPDTDTPAQKKMARVSHDPGVYLMKDAADEIIYIGKARNLKKRLAAYFKNSGHMDVKTGILTAAAISR